MVTREHFICEWISTSIQYNIKNECIFYSCVLNNEQVGILFTESPFRQLFYLCIRQTNHTSVYMYKYKGVYIFYLYVV